MSPLPITEDAIALALSALPNWKREGKAIVRTYDRRDFAGAIAFVNAIARVAEAANHHPDIAISWNNVTVETWSHDAGGLTHRDFALARAIDALQTEQP